MDAEFEWDEKKSTSNQEKHGISFDDAMGIFDVPTLETPSDSRGEARYKAIGIVDGRELAVIYTLRNDSYRIISARRARKNERRAYHQTHAAE
jgi:uncharacterized DUF497 family protein